MAVRRKRTILVTTEQVPVVLFSGSNNWILGHAERGGRSALPHAGPADDTGFSLRRPARSDP